MNGELFLFRGCIARTLDHFQFLYPPFSSSPPPLPSFFLSSTRSQVHATTRLNYGTNKSTAFLLRGCHRPNVLSRSRRRSVLLVTPPSKTRRINVTAVRNDRPKLEKRGAKTEGDIEVQRFVTLFGRRLKKKI